MKKILLLTIFLSSYSWSSDYEICQEPSNDALVSCVNSFLSKGFLPQGGVNVVVIPARYMGNARYSGREIWFQAVYQK